MAGETHKRRQILVDPDLQVGLSMHILGWLYFYVVVFALLANSSSIYSVLTADTSDGEYFDAVQRLQWFTQFTVLPLAVTFVCVAVHSIIFTHRIAGPIYRIKVTLREMAQRRFPSVKLRDKDYFKDVATGMNTVMDALREDAARQRRMNKETLDVARDLVAALERSGGADALALAHLALDRAERLDRHLGEVDPSAERVPLPPAEIAGAVPSDEPVTQVTAGAANDAGAS